MPNWIVPPSAAYPATRSPMAAHSGSGARGTGEGSGASTSRARSMRSTSISPSPRVNGIRGLTWATTRPPAGHHRLDGGGQQVDLDAEGHDAPAGRRGVEEDGVRGTGGPEQARHQGQAHGQVLGRRIPAHAGPDERRLGHEAGAPGPAVLDVEREGPYPGTASVEDPDELAGHGEVAGHHDPGLDPGSARPDARPPLTRSRIPRSTLSAAPDAAVVRRVTASGWSTDRTRRGPTAPSSR